MYRPFGFVTLIVFVLSFFLYPCIAAANRPDEAVQKLTLVENSSDKMNIAVDNYNAIRGAMETLNGEFDGNQKNFASGKKVTVSIGAGAILSVAIAVSSGGSLAPAAFAAASAKDTAQTSWEGQDLVSAMGTVSGYLSSALTDVESKYTTYNSRYSDYIRAMADHSLIRFNSDHTMTSVYTASQLDYAVNTSGIDSGYYHSSAQSPSGSSHSVSLKRAYKHWSKKPLISQYYWNTYDLEEKYECKGECTVKFGSAYDAWDSHRVVCGINRETFSSGGKTDIDDSIAPCRTAYYTCERSTCPDARYHVDDDDDTTPYHVDDDDDTTPSMHACGDHETSVSGDHSQGTYTCGQDYGYKCQESDDHATYISSCSETKDSKTCDNTSTYYECSPHNHTYPPSASCGRSSCTASVSSSTEHQGGPCASGHTYWTCNPNVNVSNWQNKHRVRTCRYSECRQTWQACVSSTPICNKPSRKQNGKKCWAE